MLVIKVMKKVKGEVWVREYGLPWFVSCDIMLQEL